jgi:subtilisin family serine protease
MSLGGSASSALDTSVSNSINAGVSYAIAAGNSNANACNYSPARVAAANTVGATTNTDARSSFSNYGTCLDIFAPGSSITSAWSTSDSATNTISGTSMASPHVAGAIALYLETNPGASPATVTQALVDNSTPNKVTNPGTGSPNRLLYSLFGGSPPGDTTPPTTSITSPANGATVSGTITVSANASDDVGVTRVELYVDGGLLGTDTSSPYQFSWNTASVANGSHSLQTRAYDAAGNVGSSAVVTVTVSNSAGGELIVNGGFEGSASPWVLSGNAYWSTGGYPHSGTGYTVLGYYNYASGSEYQTVSIPAGHPANYTFWLNVTTSESGSTAYDFLRIEVRNTSGALLATLATYSNVHATTLGNYSQKSFSLAAWRGQTVRLQFRATTDFSLPTSFRVDDVSLR